jgi:hypothetical protein
VIIIFTSISRINTIHDFKRESSGVKKKRGSANDDSLTETEMASQTDVQDSLFDSLLRPDTEIHFICFTNTPKKSSMYPPKYLKRLSKRYGIEIHIMNSLGNFLDQIIDTHKPTMCLEAQFLIPPSVERNSD